jgi:hypothetical protein
MLPVWISNALLPCAQVVPARQYTVQELKLLGRFSGLELTAIFGDMATVGAGRVGLLCPRA